MRTMLNPVALLVVGGALLFSSQSAQACHGRKCCLLCCSKSSCYGTSGYGYGYGAAYGYSPYYGYGYPSSYGYGYGYGWRPTNRAGAETAHGATTDTEAGDKLARLEEVERRLDDIENTLRELLKRTPAPK